MREKIRSFALKFLHVTELLHWIAQKVFDAVDTFPDSSRRTGVQSNGAAKGADQPKPVQSSAQTPAGSK